MGLRIGAGFRLGRHVGIYASVPLFRHHARRLAAHRGHSDRSVLDMLLGIFVMYIFVRVAWGMAFGWPSG
jgi:hypothetical protein